MDDVMKFPGYFPVIEKIKGKIYKMARPAIPHIRAGTAIFGILIPYFRGRKCEFFIEPQVQLGEDEVAPDACVVCDPSKVHDAKIVGAPDLIIEILSPSTGKKDRTDKRILYGEHGVKEYWMIEPKVGSIEIWLLLANEAKLELHDSVYFQSEETKNDLIKYGGENMIVEEFTSPTFPDLTIRLSELFYYMKK